MKIAEFLQMPPEKRIAELAGEAIAATSRGWSKPQSNWCLRWVLTECGIDPASQEVIMLVVGEAGRCDNHSQHRQKLTDLKVLTDSDKKTLASPKALSAEVMAKFGIAPATAPAAPAPADPAAPSAPTPPVGG
jgi:hypothetical protein